ATGAFTISTLKIILMSKLKIATVTTLFVAGVATPLVLQHQTVTRLRNENSALQAQTQQTDLLRGENQKLAAQVGNSNQSPSLSKAQLSELLRLRDEVDPLRRDNQELAKLRASQHPEQNAKPASATPDFVPATA